MHQPPVDERQQLRPDPRGTDPQLVGKLLRVDEACRLGNGEGNLKPVGVAEEPLGTMPNRSAVVDTQADSLLHSAQ